MLGQLWAEFPLGTGRAENMGWVEATPPPPRVPGSWGSPPLKACITTLPKVAS